MAFLLSKKIPAFPSTIPPSAAASAAAAPAYSGDHNQQPDGAPVSCCLHIKSAAAASSFLSPSAAGSPPSKDAVLRRIRHHKRANQIQEAVRTHLAFLSDQAANGSQHRWIDGVNSDTFSP